MRQKCGKYAANMRQICGKYAANMRKICGKYAANIWHFGHVILYACTIIWLCHFGLIIPLLTAILDVNYANSVQCVSSLQAFISLAESLNIALRHNKTVYPTKY